MKRLTAKKGFRTLFSCVLVFAMLFCGVESTLLAAAADNITLYYADYPRAADPMFRENWGHEELHFMNGWQAKASPAFQVFTKDSFYGKTVYCIEPGTLVRDSNSSVRYNETMDSNTFWSNVYSPAYSNGLPAATARVFLGQILANGYQGNASLDWRMASDKDKIMHWYATQILIWEVIVGERDASFNHVARAGYNTVLERLSPSFPLRNLFMQYYSMIISRVQSVPNLPSFASDSAANAPTYTMSYQNGVFTATLHNTSGDIGNYLSVNTGLSGLSFTRSGSDLIITGTELFEGVMPVRMTFGVQAPDPVIISDGKHKPERSDENAQDIIYLEGSGTASDVKDGYFNLEFPHVPKVSTVTYDYQRNGGASATKTAAQVTEGAAIDLTPTAEKPDWDFVGWNTDPAAREALPELRMGRDNVTLYAIFKQKQEKKNAQTDINIIYDTWTDNDPEIHLVVQQEDTNEIDIPLDYTRISAIDISPVDANNNEVELNGPVTVQIPLPEGFSKDHIVVYHKHTETGVVERIEDVRIEPVDGKDYIVFTTDSFSVFILVDTSEPQPDPNMCHWCGQVHTGFFGGFIAFFHRIFARLFGEKF